MKPDLETISTGLFWISVLIFVFLLVWRLVGSSPTIEQLSAIATPIFLYLALEARKFSSEHSKEMNRRFGLLENKMSEQTEVLKDMRGG